MAKDKRGGTWQVRARKLAKELLRAADAFDAGESPDVDVLTTTLRAHRAFTKAHKAGKDLGKVKVVYA